MKKILILDTSAIIYRSYYALINFRNSKGKPTGAIYGFLKQLELAINTFNPDYIIASKDVKRKDLLRTQIYDKYKQNRESMPEDLVNQLEDIDRIIKAYNIPMVTIEGNESDDVIGSLVNKYYKENKIVIITGDKDISQLLRENVSIALLGKSTLSSMPYLMVETEEDVFNNLSVYSYQIPDYFGLMGDSSDGIPGVKGIGPKSAAKLILEYGSLDNIYENIDKIKGSLKEKLLNDKEMAYISKQLATIDTNLEINLDLEKYTIKKDDELLKEIFLECEFKQEYEKLSIRDEIKLEEKIYDKLSEFVEKINSQKDNISLYIDESAISFFNGKEIYFCFNIEENTGDLFKSSIGIKNISSKLDVSIYSSKDMLDLGLSFENYFDILLASFSLGTDRAKSIEKIIFDNLKINIQELDKKVLAKYTYDEYTSYLKERLTKITYGIYQLKDLLTKELIQDDKLDLYYRELHIAKVLKYMEIQGISIDKEYFKLYNDELKQRIIEVEENIYKESGERFNISSPKQLGEILFEKMEIESFKKNKRGYSTDAEVLEMLKLRGIKIADLILNYRELVKLSSTYVEPLLKLSNNGKIYTKFNQTGTATGRLSSNNPNLQNIPTRTEEGMKIRRGFIAGKNKKLVSFDYSQIELRVLAQLSKDENLIKAYKNDLDLHELTARKIFNIPIEKEVSKSERNVAKIINFSVLYGKTAYGLSKELKISIQDAKKYIDAYFEEYPKVKTYIESIIEIARENNYVETFYGTRRYVYEVNSKNINIKEQGNRMAVNTVVQGSAANIIKNVMSDIYSNICNDKVKMLLQVHDELIFEIDEDNLEIVDKIKEIMEKNILFDKVKLKVNSSIGNNWLELK